MTPEDQNQNILHGRLDAIESLSTLAVILIVGIGFPVAFPSHDDLWRTALAAGTAGLVTWAIVRVIRRNLLGESILQGLHTRDDARVSVRRLARWCRRAGEARLALQIEDAATKAGVDCVDIRLTAADIRKMFRNNERIKETIEEALENLRAQERSHPG